MRLAIMETYQPKSEPRHDYAPDGDDVVAWIIIGLVAAGLTISVWLPLVKAVLST